MTTLRAVPETPPRAVLYLRQSVSHDDSVSLELQETAGRDYCQRQGYQIVAVESDPGISGRTWKRPAVQRVMAMIEEAQADVVVLWKWSRLSRSRRDWALAADRADVAGGRIESSTEAVDIGTATGRLTRGMLVELAAFESDRIGEVWKEVHASRLSKGLVPNGNRRFGYEWDPKEGIHKPDPIEGPALASAYARVVAGEPLYAIVQSFHARGLKTVKDGPWSYRMLHRVLDQGFAAGIITWGGKTYPGAHDPLVSPELWQAYLDRRVASKAIAPRSKRSNYLLSGMVRCGHCGGSMAGGMAPQGPRFRCNRRRDLGKVGCPAGGYVQMSVVEAEVIVWLKRRAAQLDDAATVADRTAAVRLTAEVDAGRLVAAIGRLDESLQTLTVRLAEGEVPIEAYQGARDELVARRAVMVDQLEEAGRTVRRASQPHNALAAELLELWEDLPVDVRRTMLRELIDRVVVTTSSSTTKDGQQGGSSSARVEIVGVWDEASS